jgi:hypothetical protein
MTKRYNSNIKNRRQPRRFNNKSSMMVSEKDLSTQRVSGPASPPQHVGNPPTSRKTRFSVGYAGTAIVNTITAAAILANDVSEYLGVSTPVRYNALHVGKIEAWLGLDTSPTNLLALSVIDSVSNTEFTDSLTTGVDWAHIAMRPCLYSRMTQRPAIDTTSLFVISVPAAEGVAGQLIIDVSFTAQ